MLTEFSVRNYGPFRDEAAISLIPGAPDEHPENILESEASENGILGSALIYGPNGSGKTSLLNGLLGIGSVLGGSIPAASLANPCILGSDGTSEFSVTVAGRYFPYSYMIGISKQGIESESLYQYATGRRSMVFVRSGDSFRFGKGAVKGHGTPDIGRSDAFLPSAAASEDPACSEALREIRRIRPYRGVSEEIAGLMRSGQEFKTIVLRALRICDTGISGFSGGSVVHECGGSSFSVPLESESESIRNIMAKMSAVCDALMKGEVAVVSSLGDLHPRVVRWIIEQFSAERNPNSAQLIASLYDSSAMDLKNLVRRDQIFVADRNQAGVSRMTRLTDISGIRKDTDLQKAYFGWKLGGLPRINSQDQLLRR